MGFGFVVMQGFVCSHSFAPGGCCALALQLLAWQVGVVKGCFLVCIHWSAGHFWMSGAQT